MELEQLHGLRDHADDSGFMGAVRHQARQQAAPGRLRCRTAGITLDPTRMFDVHAKRMHEYKRQLLNVLHVVTRYQASGQAGRRLGAAGGDLRRQVGLGLYFFAKLVIRLINDVAAVVNNDPRIGDRLKVVFIPTTG